MICKEGYRQNEKRIIGISKEAFRAAILAGEIAFHHAEELHVLLPFGCICIEEGVIGIEING